MTEPASDEEFLTPLQRIYLERNKDAMLRPEAEIQRRSGRKIRGFLLLIVVWMTIVTPVLTLMQLVILYGRVAVNGISPAEAKMIAIVTAIFALGSLIAGWRLAYRRVRSSVVIALWFITISSIAPVAIAALRGANLIPAVASLLWGIVWILYLLLSKRVKTVYSPDHQATGEIFE